MIDKQVKRHFNAAAGGTTGDGNTKSQVNVIEPIKLHRDSRGRLNLVEGWEYIDIALDYASNGLLKKVDVTHKVTGKHLQLTLVYTSTRLLEEVIPEIMDPGEGEAGEIDVPNVIDSY